jgi:rRNA maturation endonuclease Nob1
MDPDEAAELLQIEERGAELVKRCLSDDLINKAIQMVGSGFSPSDVASALGLKWSREAYEEHVEESLEGKIKVWQCETIRCKQKGKVATATNAPMCPDCGKECKFVMAVDSADEISHMARMSLGRPNVKDPLKRTDRTAAPYEVPDEV